MTPEQIAILNAVAMILGKVSSWPVGSIVAIMIVGPWVFTFFISWQQERKYMAIMMESRKQFEAVMVKQEKRFESVVRMYENNVELVRNYERISKSLQDLVILNTQELADVKSIANNNLFCPIVRKETQQREVDR